MTKNNLRIVFMGTPAFALPSLQMLLDEGYQVVAAFTQPDRPKGRGHKMIAPPVKQLAQQAGIPVYQYEKVSREGVEQLKALAPDLLITVAYGQILSREVLAVPPLGCINVHASLLPKYRGAAPIEWAVINGEPKAGVTTMYTVYELDAGDMLEKDAILVPPDMTGGELRETLSVLGAGTLRRTLEKLLAGTLTRTPQDETQMSYYPMFTRGFGSVNWADSCENIRNFVRGLNPAPLAYTFAGQEKVKLFAVRWESAAVSAEPGAVLCADVQQGLCVQAGDGVLRIEQLQFPGGKPMEACAYLRGHVWQTKMLTQEAT